MCLFSHFCLQGETVKKLWKMFSHYWKIKNWHWFSIFVFELIIKWMNDPRTCHPPYSMIMLNPPQGWIMLSYCLGSFCPDKAVVNGLVCCNCKCIIQDHSLVIMQATNKKTEKKCCLSTFPDMPLIAQCLWGSLSLKASSITFSSPCKTKHSNSQFP